MGFTPPQPDIGKLEDLEITTAAYGAAMNYGYGTNRYDDTVCIFAEPLREVKLRRRTKGGKQNEFTYYGTFAIAVCDHEVEKITRIWFDKKLVYDITGSGPVTAITSVVNGGKSSRSVSSSLTSYARFYLGTESQDPDPRMAAILDARIGPGAAPAYRGVTYIFFDDLPLGTFGNHLPQVAVETVTAATDTYPYQVIELPKPQPYRMWGWTWSGDFTRAVFGRDGDFTIIDAAARAVLVSGEFPASLSAVQFTFGIDRFGGIYAVGDENVVGGDIHRFSSDGSTELQVISAGVMPFGAGSCSIRSAYDGSAEYLVGYPPTLGTVCGVMTANLEIALVGVDTTDFVPGGFTVTGSCVDSGGRLYLAGSRHALFPAAETECFIVNATLYGAPLAETITVTGLAADFNVETAIAEAGDNFLITWNRRLYLVDRTGAVLASQTGLVLDVYNTFKQVENLRPGATSVWVSRGNGLVAYEISLADLSVLRTETLSNWSATDDASGQIYDPINHALITAPQGQQELAWRYLDRADGDGVQLSEIVDDVSARCGLQPGDWDASDLDQTVLGYSWQQSSGADVLATLLEAHDSEVGPHNFGLRFRKRGAAVLGSLATAQLAGSPRYTVEEPHDDDLPAIASLAFADPAIDGQANTARDRRPLSTSDGRREESLSLPTWRTDASTARQAVVGYMRRRWFSSEVVKASGSRQQTAWEPGDAYDLTLDDVSRSLKITRLEFSGDGLLNAEWARYDPAIHIASDLSGAPAEGIPPAVISIPSYTRGLVLDIPLIRDADDALITYLAAGPYTPESPWLGAEFYVSDDGVTYASGYGSVDASEQAVMGAASDALPDALATVIDRAGVVTVVLTDGVLTSCTEDEMLDGENRAILGDEMIGFTTATLTAAKTYELSGLLRGRRGTEWATATHASGERFVLLETILPTVAMGASEVGDTDYYQPITSGGASGFVQPLTFEGRSLKPYAPAHLASAEAAGDLALDWTRRTRIGGDNVYGATPPLGETTEAYVVRIFNAGGGVLRTYAGLTTPAATYSAADRATDGGLGVSWDTRQVSSVVGPGYAASASF